MNAVKAKKKKDASIKFTPTNQPTGSGFFDFLFLFIGIGAIIFFFTMVDKLEDVYDYGWQLTIIFGMLSFNIYNMFKKPANAQNFNILVEVEKDGLSFEGKELIRFEQLNMDCYFEDDEFDLYHLYDKNGKFALYSIYDDELYKFLTTQNRCKINNRKTRSIKKRGSNITYGYNENATLSYNLVTGSYQFQELNGEEKKEQPIFFMVDPRFIQQKFRPLNPY